MTKWKFDELVMRRATRESSGSFPALLEPLGITVLSPADCGVEGLAVEETGETFEQNAVIKALAYCRATGLPSVADDSGLCVDALSGAPGVYSARFGGEGLTDRQRTELLLEKMKDVPMEKRGAHFTSAVALALPTATALWCRASATGWWPLRLRERGLWLRLRLFLRPRGVHLCRHERAGEKPRQPQGCRHAAAGRAAGEERKRC